MIIEISKNRVVVKKRNAIVVLIYYGTIDDLQKWVSAWIEAEMWWNDDNKKALLKM